MKKKYLFFEFIILFLFLGLPPLLVGESQAGSDALAGAMTFSWRTMMKLAAAGCIVFQNWYLGGQNASGNNKFSLLISGLKWSSITLGLLMLIYAVIQVFVMLMAQNGIALIRSAPGSVAPATIAGWIFITLNIAVSAFYEETMYRLFFPDTLLIFAQDHPKIHWIIELSVMMVFAFSHRYMGIMAVVNAFACGAALRLCKRKSGGIAAGTAAHFVYNLSMVIFSIPG